MGHPSCVGGWEENRQPHGRNAGRVYCICMSEKIIAWLVGVVGSGGYGGVVLLMAVQSACIPIPSEVILPLAGVALVHTLGATQMQVQMQLVLLATVASLASNLGSIPAYWVGARGGRPMVERYGRWLLLSQRDLDRVDHFFAHYGSITVLVGRMLPIVRTFIAFPAGVAKMNQVRFHIYTFVGSWPWCYALAYVGVRLGDSFRTDPRFKAVFERFHLGVEAVLAVGVVWFVVSHWKGRIRTDAA